MPVHERIQLELDEGERLAVVADTHSRPHAALTNMLRSLHPRAILHAGDVGRASVLDELGAIASVHAVAGNIDHVSLPSDLEVVVDTPVRRFRLWVTHVAVRGRALIPRARAAALQSKVDVVICGHSHVPLLVREQGLVVFNPGSAGPKRFSLPISFGALEVCRGSLSFQHFDCETGERLIPLEPTRRSAGVPRSRSPRPPAPQRRSRRT